MKLAYLASHLTLPGRIRDPVYAHEHDLMMSVLDHCAKGDGGQVVAVDWDCHDTDWSDFDAALIGTTWDYHARPQAFIETLARIHQTIPVFNTPQMVIWNSRKTYLRDLEHRGARIIPTSWHDAPDLINWDMVFDRFETDELVVKRQIGANAEGQFRLRRGARPAMSLVQAVMIQPFMPLIASEGELSFIFIDRVFSHALVKKPAPDDYRSQATHGACEYPITPDRADLDAANAVLRCLEEKPLYARIDMLRDETGALCLMELELIEPYLYPEQGPDLGVRLYQAARQRIMT